VPGIARQVPNLGCGARSNLGSEPARVGFLDAIIIELRGDGILVERSFEDIRNESGPDAGIRAVEIPGAGRPAVEVADDGDFARVGRPYGEVRAVSAVLLGDV